LFQRTLEPSERVGMGRNLAHPVRFSHTLMRTSLWAKQADILKSVAQNKRTAVKACHASGKTFVAALAVLWWLMRWKDAIAITTAPTWVQVERLMWGEIRKAIGRSRLAWPETNKVELELTNGNYAIGLSTNEADRFSGFHEGHVLIVLDEAPGVRPVIYEAIEGIRAGGDVRELAQGNPVIASGPFYEAHTTGRQSWKTFTISAFDTPNLISLIPGGNVNGYTDEQLVSFLAELSDDELDRNERGYLTTRRWVWEKWHEWGAHQNPLWDARVMGRFPKQAANMLLPLMFIEQAATKEVDKRKRHRPVIGIDVAGPGEDETVVIIREGPNLLEMHCYNDPDPRGKVLRVLDTYKLRDPIVNVDSCGLGYYFAKHIEDAGYTVNRINVGVASNDPERYKILKDELYWGLRERFEDGGINGEAIMHMDDDRIISQLASIKYDHDARGRVVVRSKKEMRKDGIKSPDRAEALMLAFAGENRAGQGLEMV
jgi:hypothetical protein